MRVNDYLGSLFGSFPEPDESFKSVESITICPHCEKEINTPLKYRENCFSCRKWVLETDSQDVRYFIIRREFMTLSEQAKEWIDRFSVPETLKLDAKRLIWDIKYDDYKTFKFSSPIVIALCALKLVFDLKSKDFFEGYDKYMDTIRINTGARVSDNAPRILGNRLSNYSSKESIKFKSAQLLELIGKEKIDNIKRMWGCIDEATLLA